MQNEFDFAALSKNWQQQPVAPQAVPTASDLQRARRRQRRQWYVLAVEWVGALVMAGTAFWLITSIPGWLSTIAAVFLLLGFALSLYVSWHVHRPLLTYGNWSSHGVVEFRLRSCQLSLWYHRYNQVACGMLIAFVVVIWGLWLWQPDQVPGSMLKFYTLIALPLCVYGIHHFQQNVRRQQQLLAPLQLLAADLQCEEGQPGPEN